MGLLARLPSHRGFWSFPRQNSPLTAGPMSALGCCTGWAWEKQRNRFSTASSGWEPGSGPDPPSACSWQSPSQLQHFQTGCSDAEKWHDRVSPWIRTLWAPPGKDGGADPGPGSLPGPALAANCTSVATAADGDSSILAALIKLQKLCMLSVMRRPFINSVIKAIKHDPLVLTSLMAG